MLAEVDGLQDCLAEIGEGGGGPGLDLALGHGGKEAAQGGAQIAGREVIGGEEARDIATEVIDGDGLGFLAGVVVTEMGMGGTAGSAATATVGKCERTQGRAVQGTIRGHRDLQI